MMRKFFKDKFYESIKQPAYFKRKLNKMLAVDMDAHVENYLKLEFGLIYNTFSFEAKHSFVKGIKEFILSDRYKKKERVIDGLEFSPLRNVLTKYNNRNLIDFMSNDGYASLFVYFIDNASEKLIEEQKDVDSGKLKAAM